MIVTITRINLYILGFQMVCSRHMINMKIQSIVPNGVMWIHGYLLHLAMMVECASIEYQKNTSSNF